ncbi:MAG: DegT/DnrJ/EryC1/StrS family aminotransferase, partial [Deltaproteobacteria bacterium]|nr:DegT/DnrJ/EryC1/StrS family aminotransferase [Deltaproteobacteria bacterium]
MQFIDLATQQKRIREDLEKRLGAVLDHGRYIMGPEIEELEAKLAAFTGVPHAVGCGSGTDALLLALMALGVGPGDAVLTTPFTFVATAEAVALLGATPVFVDIEPGTWNLDPASVARALAALAEGGDGHPLPRPAREGGLTPRVLLTVDIFGLPADFDRLAPLAREHGLVVVEDAAQSFGARYHGRRAGSLGRLGCTSFFPAKPLGGYGDGGMCFCSEPELAEILTSLRVHGQGADKYQNVRVGLNARLDTFQAAVLLAKFTLFEEELELREAAAARYDRLFAAAGLPLAPQARVPGLVSAWAQYSILAPDAAGRERCLAALKEAGVPAAVYYPIPLHLQKVFAELGHAPGDFPVAEDASRRIFSLPMHPYLTEEAQESIAA